jgi:DNA-binding PadR family transcriptional regulator
MHREECEEMERRLLLLGLLQEREMYGYQINEIIDTQVGMSLRLTKPTAYRLLHNLSEEGYIKFRDEKDGNRPTRRMYSITTKGKQEFKEKLEQSLSSFSPLENVNAIGLAFLNELPKEVVIGHLESRQSEIEKTLSPIVKNQTQPGSFQLINENQILHLSAELEWLKEIIKDL